MQTEDCARELYLIVPPVVIAAPSPLVSTTGKEIAPEPVASLPHDQTVTGSKTATKPKKASLLSAFDQKDCPPGCGCDNPWAFLS